MNDLRANARRAAMWLEDQAGADAVKEAAIEALSGEERMNAYRELASYALAVSAFWTVRARFGIPALRDVLWSLNISTEGF